MLALPLSALMVALLLKRGAIVGSSIGILTLLAVGMFDARYAIDVEILLAHDLQVAAILILSVTLVIIPGQILNAMLHAAGTIKKIGAQVMAFRLSPIKTATLIVLGIAPMLESLTGFGVSLFFTIPILLRLFELRRALLLALLGMNIMPWGTLALATSIGAQLSQTPLDELAAMTAWMSFAIFPTIGLLVFFICRQPQTRIIELCHPLFGGFFLSCSLLIYNYFGAVELAGVWAGLSTAAVLTAIELCNGKKFRQSMRIHELRLFAPYLLLIGLIGLARIDVVHAALRDFWIVQSGAVKLHILTNPGVFIFLSVAICACAKFYRHSGIFKQGIRRAIYPLCSIAMFIVFAQLHRANGMFVDLAARLVDLELSQVKLIAPLLGMLSGQATGSNVGGNALLIALQSETGAHFGHQLAFAAMQNSAAGHAVFMSLPVIVLTASVAGTTQRDHQAWLVRRTLCFAPFIYLALLLPFYWSR